MNGYDTHTLPCDGLDLHYYTRGEGPSVVFQHGLCGDAAQPSEVFPAGFRHLTLDCRGHGASPAGDTLSIACFAGDVAAMIEEQNAGPCAVGGISMGAAIALRLAVTRPDLVSALILGRPAWVTDAAPDNLRPNAEVGALIAADPATAEATFAQSDTARMLAAEAPDNLASLNGFFTREPLDVTARLLTNISADGPGVTVAQVRALRLPTLVIATQADAIHPVGHAQTLADMIDGARLVEIPAKSHDRAGYTAGFQTALSQFLKETS